MKPSVAIWFVWTVALAGIFGAAVHVGYVELATPVQAAQPAPPEPAACAEWGKVGPWTLTKCEDDDGVACISSDSGMLSCKWDY